MSAPNSDKILKNTKPRTFPFCAGISCVIESYFTKMMRLAKLDDGDVFLDMGSGTGKACVAAGLLYPNLAVCRGVELLNGLHRQAEVRDPKDR